MLKLSNNIVKSSKQARDFVIHGLMQKPVVCMLLLLYDGSFLVTDPENTPSIRMAKANCS